MNPKPKTSWLSALKKKAATIASDFAGLPAEDKSGGNDVSKLNTTFSPVPMKRDIVRQKISSSLTTALGDRRHEWNVAVNGSDICYLQIVVNQNEDEGNQVSLLVDLPFINKENSTHLKSLGFHMDQDLNSPDFYNAGKDFLVVPTVDGIGDFVNQIIEILQLIQRDLDGVTEVDAYILDETGLFIAKSTKPSEIQSADFLTIPSDKKLKEVQGKNSQPKKRPDVTIGMMGHLDHGKTTLLAAISKTLSGRGLAELRSFDEVNLALQKEVEGAQGAILHNEYEFGKRKYEHVDIPGHEAYNKRMLSEAAEWDGAILVVSVIEGPMPQTRDHVIAARQVGLSYLVVALNMSDLTVDKELYELVELEMRELLSEFGFPGDSTPIVHVSALKALMGAESWQNKIMELLAAIDSLIPPSNRGQIKRESGSSSKRLKDVQAKDPKMMNFLAENFHQRFQELENHYRSGHFLSGKISEVAERIWKLSQLWMIFLDGDDLFFTQDHELYRHISDLANSHPRCTIEEEVSYWMSMSAGQMTDFEIRLALWCGVDRVGSLLVLNGNFDETLDELIQYRNRVNPAFRGK